MRVVLSGLEREPAESSQIKREMQEKSKDSAVNSRADGDGTGVSPFGKERLEAVRQALIRKRLELIEQQATQLSALNSPERHHLADLEEMSDIADIDSVCAIVDISTSTLVDVDAALEKIAEGTYGICEQCGKGIHPDRLEVLPFAALCVKCQRKREERQTRWNGASDGAEASDDS